MSTEDVRTTQTTLADDARVAGRDFFERVDVCRLDDWLALQDDDQRDAISLRNEDVFMKRFRMDLPTPLRSKLLDIKRSGNWAAAGFTDTEFGCDDETGGEPWEREGYSAASTSLRL